MTEHHTGAEGASEPTGVESSSVAKFAIGTLARSVTSQTPLIVQEPSSFSNSTCCPGSGTRGGLLLPNVIFSPAGS